VHPFLGELDHLHTKWDPNPSVWPQYANEPVQDAASQQMEQEGQHPLTGQRAANFRLLANQ